MKNTIFISMLSLILFYAIMCFAGKTIISIPDLSFNCDYSNCVIGSGSCGCQITDSNGGIVTINGFSKGQCNTLIGKKIIWENGDKEVEAKIIKSIETNNW